MAITTTHNTYGVETDIRVKRNISSKYKKRNGFVYPLAGSFKQVTGVPPALKNNASEGGYFSKAYGIALIKNNLRQLLLCEKGERVMLPSYGISLQKYVFEPLDEMTYMLVKDEVLRTLYKYFGIAKVLSLRVFSEEPYGTDRQELIISLTLQLLDESLDIFDVEVTVA